MSNLNQRETNTEQPQNIQANSLPTDDQTNPIQKPQKQKPDTSTNELQQYSSSVSEQAFEKMILESQQALRKIDQFNSIVEKSQIDYIVIEELFSNHIKNSIHPTSCSDVGDFLLRNGKFIATFIEVVCRKQTKDLLKKYLFNYFQELNKISQFKQYFKEKKEQLYRNERNLDQRSNRKQNKNEKSKLLLSPESSGIDGNWSTKVEQDVNSPLKSSIFGSQYVKKSEKQLKRLTIKESHDQINRDDEVPDEGKNTKKLNTNSRKKTQREKQQSKQKSIKSEKKTKQKSAQKQKSKNKQTIYSKQKKKDQTSQKQQRQKIEALGSCYHYQISLNPKSLQKELYQRRTSARLSKGKHDSVDKVRPTSVSRKSSKSKPHKRNRNQTKNTNEKRTKKRNQQITDTDSDNSIDSQLQIEWIKEHLKELNIHNVQLYSDFTALTKNDERITKFLLEMESSQQASQAFSYPRDQQPSQQTNQLQIQEHQQQNDRTETRITAKQPSQPSQAPKVKKFSQIKKDYQIQKLPLTIDYVVDPNINHHGIYCLLKLGRVSELEMGTAYAVSPLTYGLKVNRKHVKEDLDSIKILVGVYGDNVGYIPMNQKILDLIEKAKKK